MSADLLDYEPLENFVVLGYQDYSDILADAIREVPHALLLIREAVLEDNYPVIRSRAHSLKGMLSYFGCKALTVRLAQLDASHFTTPSQADAVYNELGYYWQESLTAIRQWEKTVPGFAP